MDVITYLLSMLGLKLNHASKMRLQVSIYIYIYIYKYIYIYIQFIHICNVDNSSEFMKMRKSRSTWCVYIATTIAVHFVNID